MKSSKNLETYKIIIKEWQEEDFEIIREILITTWLDAYSFIPEKDLKRYLDTQYSHKSLLAQFNHPSMAGFIALHNSEPSGFMKLIENKVEVKFFVSSLYVLPNKQGFGIGKILLNKAIEIAKNASYNEIWLGVMKQNEKSVEWYKKLGFVFPSEEPFKLGSVEVQHLIGYKSI